MINGKEPVSLLQKTTLAILLRDDSALWDQVIQLNFPSIEMWSALKDADIKKYWLVASYVIVNFSKEGKSYFRGKINDVLIHVTIDNAFEKVLNTALSWINRKESSLLELPWDELSEDKLRVMQHMPFLETFATCALEARVERMSTVQYYKKQKQFSEVAAAVRTDETWAESMEANVAEMEKPQKPEEQKKPQEVEKLQETVLPAPLKDLVEVVPQHVSVSVPVSVEPENQQQKQRQVPTTPRPARQGMWVKPLVVTAAPLPSLPVKRVSSPQLATVRKSVAAKTVTSFEHEDHRAANAKEMELSKHAQELAAKEAELSALQKKYDDLAQELTAKATALREQEAALVSRSENVAVRETEYASREAALSQQEAVLAAEKEHAQEVLVMVPEYQRQIAMQHHIIEHQQREIAARDQFIADQHRHIISLQQGLVSSAAPQLPYGYQPTLFSLTAHIVTMSNGDQYISREGLHGVHFERYISGHSSPSSASTNSGPRIQVML